MTRADRSDSSFGRADSLRAQRSPFLFRCRAPRRGCSPSSRDARRNRAVIDRSGRTATTDRGGRFRARAPAFRPYTALGAFAVQRAQRPQRPQRSPRSRHRPGRIPRAPPAHRTGPRQAHRRRPRLPRSLRFPRGISARQRCGSGHGARARSLRDVFGHTASISRRHTS
jgi:hypothetical protein